MGLRPSEAGWFEMLVPRTDLTRALARLAETGAVELETEGQPDHPFELPGLAAAVAEFNELERRFGPWWPEGLIPALNQALEPVEVMQQAMRALNDWSEAAQPLIEQAELIDVELARLTELEQIVAGDNPGLPDFALVAAAGPLLSARLYRLPPEAEPDELPAVSLSQVLLSSTGRRYLLVLGPVGSIARLDERMAVVKARRIELPDWLPARVDTALSAIAERRSHGQNERRDLGARIDALSRQHELPRHIGSMALMQWFAGHAPALPVTEHFVMVTGWCSDRAGQTLVSALEDAGIAHVLRARPAPRGMQAPVIMNNPRWVRPFELFPNLLGTPAATEVDPSRILAVVTPVMFGFMFGDVGQGAVLLALGLWLRKRLPVFGLLVPFGAMAIVFGFLFGSVFANEELIPALWMHPIDYPTTVMGIALGFGVFIISLGLFFDALRALWSGSGLHWLLTRAGLILAYFGIIGAFFNSDLLNLTWLGFAWFVIGTAAVSEHSKLKELPKAIGELLESMLQLLVNTISFVRVGAFALAHAGLSAAVFGMADAAGGGFAGVLVIILGNVIVIALEGLIVSIQTTRLMLFEFFIRFLTAEGRRFKPLTGPGTVFRPTGRSPT